MCHIIICPSLLALQFMSLPLGENVCFSLVYATANSGFDHINLRRLIFLDPRLFHS